MPTEMHAYAYDVWIALQLKSMYHQIYNLLCMAHKPFLLLVVSIVCGNGLIKLAAVIKLLPLSYLPIKDTTSNWTRNNNNVPLRI